MPLEHGAKPGTPGFSRNVATEVRAGKPQKQAVAIAYREGGEKRGDASYKGPMEPRGKGKDEQPSLVTQPSAAVVPPGQGEPLLSPNMADRRARPAGGRDCGPGGSPGWPGRTM